MKIIKLTLLLSFGVLFSSGILTGATAGADLQSVPQPLAEIGWHVLI